MKNLKRKFYGKMEELNQKAEKKAIACICRAKTVLEDEQGGFSGFTTEAMLIIGGLVVGAAVVAAVLYMFRDTVIPAVQTKIMDIFSIS